MSATVSPLTTIISDYGGVLTSPLSDAFAQIDARHALPGAALNAAMTRAGERRGVNLLAELECGRLSEPEFMTVLGLQLSDDLGRTIDLSAFSEHYFAALAPNALMLDALAALRADGYRMSLLTNNVREWEPLWRAKLPDVEELFEVIVDS